MSAQDPVKNWKGPAYAAIAKYYEVEAEREAFEERLEAVKQAAMKLGVSFRFSAPEVSASDAVRCPCGTVVPLDFESREVKRGPDGVLHCGPCRTKTLLAQQEDAVVVGRPEDLKATGAAAKKNPKKTPAPSSLPAPKTEDDPF